MVWILFLVSSFISSVTLLNMLIAIMGDTFGRVYEIRNQSALRETIGIMADYAVAVPRNDEN